MSSCVVDDEQLAREELCYQLEQLGDIEIVGQASNGLEALAAVERHEPDLVFLDIQMPGLGGFEVARRLLEQGRRAAGPGLRHRIRPARDRGVRGERRGLPAEAGRIGHGWSRRSSGRAGGSRPSGQGPAGPIPVNDQLEQIVKMMAGPPNPARSGGYSGWRAVHARPGRGNHLCLAGGRVD